MVARKTGSSFPVAEVFVSPPDERIKANTQSPIPGRTVGSNNISPNETGMANADARPGPFIPTLRGKYIRTQMINIIRPLNRVSFGMTPGILPTTKLNAIKKTPALRKIAQWFALFPSFSVIFFSHELFLLNMKSVNKFV